MDENMAMTARSKESTQKRTIDTSSFMVRLSSIPGIEYEEYFTGQVAIELGKRVISVYAYNGCINFTVLLAALADPRAAGDHHGRLLNAKAHKLHGQLWRIFTRENKIGMSNLQLLKLYTTVPTVEAAFCDHVAAMYIKEGCKACGFR